jgi:membrane protein YdbS with pleckstrin-like domain
MLLGAELLWERATLGFVPWTAFLLLGGVWTLWYPARAYRSWGYRVEDRVLEIRSGVWFRVIRLLPLSRLQHVDLHRGPIERAHGLASLTLHTAGTREASLGIPGLADADAERLRDLLVTAGGDDAV